MSDGDQPAGPIGDLPPKLGGAAPGAGEGTAAASAPPTSPPAAAAAATAPDLPPTTPRPADTTPDLKPTSATDAAAAGVAMTPYGQAMALFAAGKKRDEILAALKGQSLDDESIAVVLNSLPDAVQPSKLPEVNFDQGTNALSPEVLSVLNLGIEGSPVTVAMYWFAFGAILAFFVSLILLVGETELLEQTSSPWAIFAYHSLPWVAYPMAAFAIGRAAFLLFRKYI